MVPVRRVTFPVPLPPYNGGFVHPLDASKACALFLPRLLRSGEAGEAFSSRFLTLFEGVGGSGALALPGEPPQSISRCPGHLFSIDVYRCSSAHAALHVQHVFVRGARYVLNEDVYLDLLGGCLFAQLVLDLGAVIEKARFGSF